MFKQFAKQIEANFAEMSKHELFVTVEDTELLWQTYLSAFPEGTNPIYKVRGEHDCSCCKRFIKNIGNVICYIDGFEFSIWSGKNSFPYPYNIVADKMSSLVNNKPITSVFRKDERKYGAETTSQFIEKRDVKIWHHFHAKIVNRHYTTDVAKTKANFMQKLYRGAEHKAAVVAFSKHFNEYHCTFHKDYYVWLHCSDPGSIIRNTVIGTLITDLSEGVDVAKAVRSFEFEVAPTNYKRPSAVNTPMMVKGAIKTIE